MPAIKSAISKAAVLIEALPYMQAYENKIVVVKLGGSFMGEAEEEKKVLTDIAFMDTVGMRPIVVHGGGKEITAAMDKAGLEAQFVQGLRYTDERTLAIAEHVLCNTINGRYVQMLSELGCKAMALHSLSSCVLFGNRKFLSGAEGQRVDVGLVGEVTNVNAELLMALCAANVVPVIAPIARDFAGGRLNVNADAAAGQVAAAVKAEKLVMMSDTHGIYRDLNDPDSRYSTLNQAEIADLVKEGIINKGMLPKTEACLTALKAGVKKTHIIDGQIPHSALLEIFTDSGVGTMITL